MYKNRLCNETFTLKLNNFNIYGNIIALGIDYMASNSTKIINREAGEQATGFLYQKQRVVSHIFDTLTNSDEFFFAIEYLDDIFGHVFHDTEEKKILEQDKYYDSNTSFTFSSREIYTSVINFLENWLENKRTSEANYIFVATNKIGKEYETTNIKDMEIKLPEVPILSLLINRDYQRDLKIIENVRAIIITKYKNIYSKSETNGLLAEIVNMQESDWINFLDRIEFLFESSDIDTLEQDTLNKIKESKLFNKIKHKGKESYINSQIMHLLEKRQAKQYPANFVTYSDIKSIFLELGTYEQNKPEDPLWEAFENVSDIRGIEGKIKAVTPEYNIKKIQFLQRKIANASVEENKASNKQQYLGQKYRIFMRCSELLLESNQNANITAITEEQLDSMFEELYREAEANIVELSKTYNYPYNNKETIKGMVLSLFNECYLAFDDYREDIEI